MSEQAIRVVVIGAAGRMGREALRALSAAHGFEVTGAIGRSNVGEPARALAGPDVADVTLEADVAAALDRSRPDVVLDLSLAPAAVANATAALTRRIPIVSGVTGLSNEDLEQIRALSESHATPAMVVPNFAIGAVLMMRFAELAARWMPDAEVVEMHHEKKLDAPSGTAMMTAQRIAAARTAETTVPPTKTLKTEGARGGDVDGVRVHSIRLPGYLAHQEVMFGAPGEVLTLRHDAADRSVYMEGVRLCLRRIRERSGLTVGMDALLFDAG